MELEPGFEGKAGISRIEAFSDGVMAIIITIMVLELKVPEQSGLQHLWELWPKFFAYVLSYAYLAIYWVNHHKLFGKARIATNSLLWSNVLALFALSLVPFSTAYLSEQHFSDEGCQLYLASLLFPALAYSWLQRVVRRTGDQSTAAMRFHTASIRKGVASCIIYSEGFAATFFTPWIGIACAVIVAIFWFLLGGPSTDCSCAARIRTPADLTFLLQFFPELHAFEGRKFNHAPVRPAAAGDQV